MVVEYLIARKTLTIKNLVVKFQAPFSQKIINMHLYISYIKAFITSVRIDVIKSSCY